MEIPRQWPEDLPELQDWVREHLGDEVYRAAIARASRSVRERWDEVGAPLDPTVHPIEAAMGLKGIPMQLYFETVANELRKLRRPN